MRTESYSARVSRQTIPRLKRDTNFSPPAKKGTCEKKLEGFRLGCIFQVSKDEGKRMT